MFIKILKKFIPVFFKNFFRRIYFFFTWNVWINYSYSQEGEDMILKRIFEKKEGFFVDVGAHHPKRFSNTYLLYQKGWRGINIDAMPGSMYQFNKYRSRDINVEMGVGKKEGILNYYIFNEPALNTFSKKIANKINKGNNFYFLKKIIKVEIKRLDVILRSYIKNCKIDILNVDTEGFDFDVLKSNDWNKYRPKIVLVEILSNNFKSISKHPIVKFLKKKNYEMYAKQLNTFFFKNKTITNFNH